MPWITDPFPTSPMLFRGADPLYSQGWCVSKGWPNRGLHLPGHPGCVRDGCGTQAGLITQSRNCLNCEQWYSVEARASQCAQSSCYRMQRACLRRKPTQNKMEQGDGKRPSPYDII